MKDFTRLSATERSKIETARLNLLCAAAALQGVLYDAHNPGVRGLIREHCDMNETFIPAPRLGIIGILERLDDNRCPECGNTATGEDCCDCVDMLAPVELEPWPATTQAESAAAAQWYADEADREHEPNTYDGTYSEA